MQQVAQAAAVAQRLYPLHHPNKRFSFQLYRRGHGGDIGSQLLTAEFDSEDAPLFLRAARWNGHRWKTHRLFGRREKRLARFSGGGVIEGLFIENGIHINGVVRYVKYRMGYLSQPKGIKANFFFFVTMNHFGFFLVFCTSFLAIRFANAQSPLAGCTVRVISCYEQNGQPDSVDTYRQILVFDNNGQLSLAGLGPSLNQLGTRYRFGSNGVMREWRCGLDSNSVRYRLEYDFDDYLAHVTRYPSISTGQRMTNMDVFIYPEPPLIAETEYEYDSLGRRTAIHDYLRNFRWGRWSGERRLFLSKEFEWNDKNLARHKRYVHFWTGRDSITSNTGGMVSETTITQSSQRPNPFAQALQHLPTSELHFIAPFLIEEMVVQYFPPSGSDRTRINVEHRFDAQGRITQIREVFRTMESDIPFSVGLLLFEYACP